MSKERELLEMRDLLHDSGYDPRAALELQKEGMGPEELHHRIRTGVIGPGTLNHTHGLVHFKKSGKKSVPDVFESVSHGGTRFRHYDYVVYPSVRVEGEGVKALGSGAAGLTAAKALAKKRPGSGIYNVSRGGFDGWINYNGRYVSFRRGS